MAAYLSRLADRLVRTIQSAAHVSVMGSAGSLMSLNKQSERPCKRSCQDLQEVRAALGSPDCAMAAMQFSLDMGGTSTDVAAIVSDLNPIDEGRIGPHPIRIPVLPIEPSEQVVVQSLTSMPVAHCGLDPNPQVPFLVPLATDMVEHDLR